MKRAASIFLTALILLNTLGYYGIFFGLEYRNGERMISKFDDETYDISKAVVIKLRITIPYAVDSRSFERVDGTFEHKGEYYRLIKQKFYKDTLHVVCIKDERHREIREELTRYTNSLSDHTDQATGMIKTIDFIKDYLPNTTGLCIASEGWQASMNGKLVIMQISTLHDRCSSPPPKHS